MNTQSIISWFSLIFLVLNENIAHILIYDHAAVVVDALVVFFANNIKWFSYGVSKVEFFAVFLMVLCSSFLQNNFFQPL